jgi:hypothetical protein
MASPDRPGVSVIRDAAKKAVAAESLRPVAARIGLSTMGLHAFLLGSTPRHATEEKLRAWYTAVVLEDARATADQLLAHLPEARRAGALPRLMDALEEFYRGEGERPPWWIGVLREDGLDG